MLFLGIKTNKHRVHLSFSSHSLTLSLHFLSENFTLKNTATTTEENNFFQIFEISPGLTS